MNSENIRTIDGQQHFGEYEKGTYRVWGMNVSPIQIKAIGLEDVSS